MALPWRTVRRALWALTRSGALAAADYFGALFWVAAVTGKAYAFELAYDDLTRLNYGLGGAFKAELNDMPLPWSLLATPPLLLARVLPALLVCLTFVLHRVLVVDRALLARARQRSLRAVWQLL